MKYIYTTVLVLYRLDGKCMLYSTVDLPDVRKHLIHNR